MTSHRRKRCLGCGIKYSYQASGHGAPKYNDATYCQSCREIVVTALKTIPTKFKKDLVVTTEVTLEQLKEWELHHREEYDRSNNIMPYARRIGTGMYDSRTNQVMKDAYVTGIGYYHHRVFNYQYWPGKEDEVEIREEVEVNIETGATRPWSLSAGRRQMPKNFTDPIPGGALPIFGDGPDQVPTTKKDK